MTVLVKLNEARKRFHATKIEKTGHNKFAGYKYFELSDFLVPALNIFESLKLSAVVSFGKELATMTLTDLEDGTQFVITSPMSTAALKACHEVQNLGAVQTYLRRYLWVAALEIVEHDAIDSSAGPEKPEAKQPAKKKTDANDYGQPNSGAGDGLSDDRKAIVEETALFLIDAHEQGADMKAINVWYSDDTFQDNDERLYCWSLLKAHSKLRSAIKANNPRNQEATV